MLDYSFNEFVLIYSLYFVCYYLFRGRLKKWYWVYKIKDSMRKINNSFKILMNKPNIGIVTSKASRLQDITFQEIWMLGLTWIPLYQMPPKVLNLFFKIKKNSYFLYNFS